LDGAWSGWKLVGVAAGLFVLHLGAVLLLGARTRPRPPTPEPAISVRWIPAALSADQLAVAFFTSDPVEGVLPSRQGFSAEGWLKIPPLRPLEISWPDPDHWMELEPSSLGQALSLLDQMHRPLLAGIELTTLPEAVRPPARMPGEPVRPATTVLLSEGLQQRLAAPVAPLPSVTASDVLTNTVVQLSVDENGKVTFARLSTASGLAEADAKALKAALDLDFQPVRPARTDSGRMTVQWHTVPPTETPK
jgi:TonB family protein